LEALLDLEYVKVDSHFRGELKFLTGEHVSSLSFYYNYVAVFWIRILGKSVLRRLQLVFSWPIKHSACSSSFGVFSSESLNSSSFSPNDGEEWSVSSELKFCSITLVR
jgi:hypothetical protein